MGKPTSRLCSGDFFADHVRQAPLVPAVLALTAGLVLDRFVGVPLGVSLFLTAAGIVAWAMTSWRTAQLTGMALVWLWGSVAALGMAYHHWHREAVAADDIGRCAEAEPRPVLLRGVLDEEPTLSQGGRPDPLRTFPRRDTTQTVVQVTQLKQGEDWLTVSGRVRLTTAGILQNLHVGDAIEVVGRLLAPRSPGNPGELDYASWLRDQRITAVVSVEKSPDGVTCLDRKWPGTAAGWLAAVRGWAHRTLEEWLPVEQRGLALALLLGEDTALQQDDWERFQTTGVLHVLAISGQHLVVLAGFLWLALRPLQLRRRPAVCLVTLFLLGYALLTGGRPPVLRAAVMIGAFCGGVLLRRPVQFTNAFALAWLLVCILNPTDIFTGGCQLSFLAVAVLCWGVGRWSDAAAKPDPLEQLIEESRPAWQKGLRWLGKQVLLAYVVGLAVWLALAPLLAARYHLVSPVVLVIGPITVLLTSIALLAGFLLLVLAPLCAPLAQLTAWPVRWSLAGCDLLVRSGEGWPGAYIYVGDIPGWWLWIFYLGLLAGLTLEPLRQRWRWLGLAGMAWLCIGLLAAALRPTSDELRCTFLAVGHGGCTVLETADGRTLLYDAGALSGADVTRRQVAPYLWSRGVRRIDEVFLSHADLDHFNGVIALLDRFAVGQVTCTPTFADRNSPGVSLTLEALRRRSVPLRIVRTGDQLTAGDLSLEVLHPPAVGPAGNENARSMVLRLRHLDHTLLLTGDLEGPGLERLLAMPAAPVDVLMAPHHGSRTANTPELAAWARPKVAVSCQGPPRSAVRAPDPYTAAGARYLTTWSHGAIIIRSGPAGLVAETFRTRECWLIDAR